MVLPAYNEAANIDKAVLVTAETLFKITDRFEIIIAEDGSKDGTDRIASRLAEQYAYVVHLHSEKRQGRGKALNRAFKAASGEVLCYIDVDLATDMKYLEKLIRAVSTDGYDFATGSRMMPDSDAKRPFKREFASRGYNFLVRLFLHSKLYDHQCGFKAFKREALFELLDETKNEHWFWDTEILVRAQHKEYRVMELPVYWRHGGSSKVNLAKDVKGMGSEIFRLWRELSSPLEVSGKGKFFLTAALAILILAFVATFLGASDILENVKQASFRTLVSAALVYCVSWPLRGVRFQQILNRLGNQYELGFLTGSIFISQSANVILPARIGDLSRMYILKKSKDLAFTTSFSSITVERVFDIVAITSIAILASSGATSRFELEPWMESLIKLSRLAVVLFFLILFIVSFREGNARKRLEIRNSQNGLSGKIKIFASTFLHQISIVAVRPRSFLAVTASSLLIWGIDIFTCFLVLKSFPTVGESVSSTYMISLIFLAVALGNIAKIIPITPGAIGTYEVALTAVFGLGGIKPEIGFTVAVLDHIIKNSITLIGGGLALSELGLRWREVLCTDKDVLKG
ncbi:MULTISPECIES: flippase-like domain-containing protein [Methanosarcina]|uniref:Dolichol-P-glucose synthetase n=3 Tax=Methanosarcina barkeri TaxID=2208 RepID=A0A0E3QYT8_METBA|nr:MULTISPECIES: flippase-like domain-containing protein [Methanosarcina]AKB56074.1 Dolichol-P-glucose synthetase [Methanosarcina barkeri MS]AKB59550.1 Dolichol-P-glucose synthetase [Methanosarcina barkeri 227]AKJ40208.1 glycosyl transferase GT2 family [Methanosarcina barkeri CM1]OEC90055.1 dolichol-P-glucose synthetase [Methanosarcina sp. A14]